MDLDASKVLSDLSQVKEPNPIINNEVLKIIEYYKNKYEVNKAELELTLNLQVENHEQFVILSNNSLTFSLESLMYAIQENLITTVCVLIKEDPELINKLDANKNTPTHFALKLGRTAIVKLLIENPMNLNLNDKEGNTLLHLAAHSDLYSIFTSLRPLYDEEKIFAKNVHNDDCVHVALRSGSNEIFMYIEALGNIKYDTLGSNRNTYLHFAAIGDCDETVLNILISKTKDINCLNLFERTPLHEALLNGSRRAASVLFSHGSNINLVGIYNENCFHFAAQGNCYKMIDILSEKDKNNSINAKSYLGLTPLHMALADSATEMVEKLIEKNADLNSLDLQGNSIFHYIAKKNLVDLIKYLDKTSPLLCHQNIAGYTPLHLSIKYNSYQVFMFLIEHDKSNVNSYCWKTNNTLLHTAAIAGNFSYVYGLLSSGANPDAKNEEGNTPIQLALRNKNLACVEILLLYPRNIHHHFCRRGYGVLHYATYCSPDIIEKIIEANNMCSLYTRNRVTNDSLYHSAVENENLEVVEFLISQNINQWENKAKVTPLHLAGTYGYAKIFKTLLDVLDFEAITAKDDMEQSVLERIILSGNIDLLDILKDRLAVLENPLDLSQLKDRYILHKAIGRGRLDTMHTLLSNDVLVKEINSLDDNGFAPLHYAAQFGNLEAVECLISFGCNVNVGTKKYSKTPLHLAVISNKIEMVKYLVQIGVKLNQRDKRGYTALHFAVVYGHKDILIYLIQCHAKTTFSTHIQVHSPLLLATALDQVNIMEYLVNCDEDMYALTFEFTRDLYTKALNLGAYGALKFIRNYDGPNYNIIKLLSKDVEEML